MTPTKQPWHRCPRVKISSGLAIIVLGIVISACADKPNSSTRSQVCDPSPCEALPPGGETLNFSVRDGLVYNEFYRRGPLATHTVLTSGTSPRLIVAFPAGNSGVSLWFKPGASPVNWQSMENIQTLKRLDDRSNSLYGIEAELKLDGNKLEVDQAVLGSVRVIRDYLHTSRLPGELVTQLELSERGAYWHRERLDGKSSYQLGLEIIEGASLKKTDNKVVFSATGKAPMRLKLTALSGDTPLTPIEKHQLLSNDQDADELSLNILAFLSYEEKLLAGSWRFLTYFGRDTLLSLRLLMPDLSPAVIEAGLGSVFNRLNPEGEVAHEEDIGEFAILRRKHQGELANSKPVYDYKMVDDNYLLAPVVAHYLLDMEAGKRRASAFLARETIGDASYGEALVRNLTYVLDSAQPFFQSADPQHMIHLEPGEPIGEWRDSHEGLGGGRVAYNVNAVFVPAALEAIARLHESGLLDPYVKSANDKTQWHQAAAMHKVWSQKAPALFDVRLSPSEAKQRLQAYSRELGLPTEEALSATPDSELSFPALALDEQGQPISVLNSDYGFAMLFGEPPEADLVAAVEALVRPFPAGLLTPVGMVVANPAYANADIRPLFSPSHYHGAVVWSWQQALFAAGLNRQLARGDLTDDSHRLLTDAKQALWTAIAASQKVKTSELWSWSYERGQYRIQPFGQRQGDKSESNAAQLWSTVYLSVEP